MSVPVLAVLAATLASVGAYLIYSSVTFGWRGVGPRVSRRHRTGPDAVRTWMVQAGLGQVRAAELVAAVAAMALVGAIGAYLVFGGILPTLVAAGFAAAYPVSAYRARRAARMADAAEAWPRLLEELRLRTGSLGRSIPQALFEVGHRAPAEWRPAFAAAEREWLLTTDFPLTIALLKDRLADPAVDAVCETLEMAHEIGGSDLDAKLADLIEERVVDLQGRKDASSRLAGVRFARRFVLLVPLGMAVAGLTIGTGRAAYETAGGQIAVACGLLAVIACWGWSGRLMRLPAEPRVFR
jgi:tight adherence protein B